MNILIAVASRHGSTHEIAGALGRELRVAGHTVDVWEAEQAPPAAHYDAALVGSAVYMGSWLPAARDFVERNRDALTEIPVWLFSSGPLGADDPKPHGDPAQIPALMAEIGASGHRTFVGNLDPATLGFGERLVTRAVKPEPGDFRDWPAIRAWADEIAAALAAHAPAGR